MLEAGKPWHVLKTKRIPVWLEYSEQRGEWLDKRQDQIDQLWILFSILFYFGF